MVCQQPLLPHVCGTFISIYEGRHNMHSEGGGWGRDVVHGDGKEIASVRKPLSHLMKPWYTLYSL